MSWPIPPSPRRRTSAGAHPANIRHIRIDWPLHPSRTTAIRRRGAAPPIIWRAILKGPADADADHGPRGGVGVGIVGRRIQVRGDRVERKAQCVIRRWRKDGELVVARGSRGARIAGQSSPPASLSASSGLPQCAPPQAQRTPSPDAPESWLPLDNPSHRHIQTQPHPIVLVFVISSCPRIGMPAAVRAEHTLRRIMDRAGPRLLDYSASASASASASGSNDSILGAGSDKHQYQNAPAIARREKRTGTSAHRAHNTSTRSATALLHGAHVRGAAKGWNAARILLSCISGAELALVAHV
ncbi:hypothetical protein FIBSPDRAFT_962503 [Athelia psychrophila]|uniref:Uncharacterized protein n=1 Tax=Athelia psychrophila TaxID=1759441 RepID=A0A166A2C6_9AGAM|nr:hypothetical protein FIBSPDRAFT_962503 [Fibularhizoctonia sp. CBS 109695]